MLEGCRALVVTIKLPSTISDEQVATYLVIVGIPGDMIVRIRI